MPNPEDPSEKFRRLVESEADTQAEPPSEQAAEEKNTPVVHHPAIDENGMPLPRRVEEIDMGATRVTPSAFTHGSTGTVRRPARRPGISKPVRPPFNWPKAGSCLLRGSIVFVFIIVALALVIVAAGIYEYYSIAASLPSVSDLQQRAAHRLRLRMPRPGAWSGRARARVLRNTTGDHSTGQKQVAVSCVD